MAKILLYSLCCAIALMVIPAQARLMVDNPFKQEWGCVSKDKRWLCYQTSSTLSDLYAPGLSDAQKRSSLVYALGWVSESSDSPMKASICRGHYFQAPLPLVGKEKSFGETRYKILYDKLTSYGGGEALTLRGNVEIIQPNKVLFADRVDLTIDSKTKQIKMLKAYGHIRVEEKHGSLLARSGSANLEQHTAELSDAYYLFHLKRKASSGIIQPGNGMLDVHGHADHISQLSETEVRLDKTSYTACPPTVDTWNLNAEHMWLNRKTGRGTAHNIILDVYNVPVFYFPYLSFPIDDRRQSGFLYPSFNWSYQNSFGLSLPYYFNLAPNYDDTLTPTFLSKRGILWGNTFRFLGPHNNQVTIDSNVLPYDRSYQRRTRSQLELNAKLALANDWKMSLRYQRVSDDDFIKNVIASGAQTANQFELQCYINLSKSTTHWQYQANATDYQVIIDNLDPDNQLYSTLPMLSANGQYANLFPHLSWGVDMQAVNFVKTTLSATQWDTPPPMGQRVHLHPYIDFPFQSEAFSITPKLAYDATRYQIQYANGNDLSSAQRTRGLPVLTVDSKVHFDRSLQLGRSRYKQTLTPHLYYAYVPYQNQSDLPIFDTGITNFSYDQLFQPNIFTGLDRVDNANRISYAVESKLESSSSTPIVSIAVGQAYSFTGSKVSTCVGRQCSAAQGDSGISDLASLFTVNINPFWSFNTSSTYNIKKAIIDSQIYGLQYRYNNAHIFNFGFRQYRYDFSQLTPEQIQHGDLPQSTSDGVFSSIWQWSPKWSMLGRWDYSFKAQQTVDVFAGLEYSACCFSGALMLHRYLALTDPNNPSKLQGKMNSAIMLQFSLKGLGGIGGHDIQQELAQIPGYKENDI